MEQYEKVEPLYKEANQNLLNQLNTYYPALSEKEKLNFMQTIEYRFKIFNSFVFIRFEDNPSITAEMFDLSLATKGLINNNEQCKKKNTEQRG